MKTAAATRKSICSAALLLGIGLGGPPATHGAQGDCGQPMSTGAAPTATDALFVLRAAVGAASCETCVCDVDSSGGANAITATDALKVLSRAVGQAVVMNCPACAGSSCFDQEAPACNGSCPSGLTCAEDPFEAGECDCLNACELSAAPTCGGSCEAEENPGLICQTLGFSAPGGPVDNVCLCVRPDIQFCTDASAPTCDGVCQPGATCTLSNSGTCSCTVLPLQPACASAQAPTCAGTCDDGFICQDSAGGCQCVVFTTQTETCFDAEAPVCGGVCAFGETCGVDFLFECECFAPCELGEAPACGGACLDPGSSCVKKTLHFGGKTLDFCGCD